MSSRLFAAVGCLCLALAGCNCNPPCTTGTASCSCRAGACDPGLTCQSDGKCAAPVTSNIRITDPNARGCELVLTEQASASVASVTFKNDLKGTWVREAPKVAVTFVAGGDRAISDGSVVLALSGGAVSVASASCVDLLGKRLTGNPVEIK